MMQHTRIQPSLFLIFLAGCADPNPDFMGPPCDETVEACEEEPGSEPPAEPTGEPRDENAPTLAVAPGTILDERSFEVGFAAGTQAPCFFHEATDPATTTLAFDASDPTSVPTVHKYAVNTAAPAEASECTGPWEVSPRGGLVHDVAANPIVWELTVTDDTTAADQVAVTFRLRGPETDDFGPLHAAEVVQDETDVTHRIVITSDTAPALGEISGQWALQVVAEDEAGNRAALSDIRFDVQLLGGPILVRSVAAAPSFLVDPRDSSLAGNGSISSALTSGSGKNVYLGGIEVINPTDRPVHFAPMLQVADAGASWARRARNREISAVEGQQSCSTDKWLHSGSTVNCVSTTPAAFTNGSSAAPWSPGVSLDVRTSQGARVAASDSYGVSAGGSLRIYVVAAPLTFLRNFSYANVVTSGDRLHGRVQDWGMNELRIVPMFPEPMDRWFKVRFRNTEWVHQFSLDAHGQIRFRTGVTPEDETMVELPGAPPVDFDMEHASTEDQAPS